MNTGKVLPLIFSLILLVPLVSAEICIDNEPPTAPSNLVITDSPYDPDGDIYLSWDAATDTPDCSGIDHYNIYRSEDGEFFDLVGESTDTEYDDLSLAEGTYYYRITAVDKVEFNPHEGPPSGTESVIVGEEPTTSTTVETTTTTGGGGGKTTGGSGPYCGDGTCQSDEDFCECPEDCEPELECGECEESVCKTRCETCTHVEEVCEPIENCCGNGVCEEGEDSENCSRDCQEQEEGNEESTTTAMEEFKDTTTTILGVTGGIITSPAFMFSILIILALLVAAYYYMKKGPGAKKSK